jgi:hypothetical protein
MTTYLASNPIAWFLLAIAGYFVFLFKFDGPRSSLVHEGLQRWRRYSGSVLAIFLSFSLLLSLDAKQTGPDASEMIAIGSGLVVAALIHLLLDRRELSQASAMLPRDTLANAGAVPSRESGISSEELERLRQGDIDARLKSRVEEEIEGLGRRIEGLNARADTLHKARARGPFAYSLNLENRPSFSKPLAWTLIGLMLAILVGALLEVALVGRGFLFAYSEQYRLIAILAIVPMTWLGMRGLKKFGAQWWLPEELPTRWIRRYIAYPSLLLMGLGLIVVAPLGWISLAGWAGGTPFAQLPGTMISANDRPRRDCNYRDRLEVDGIWGSICMRGRVTGAHPKAGDKVVVSGRRSALGIYVENVRLRH